MSTRIEPRDSHTEILRIAHERCGHETQIVVSVGAGEPMRKAYDRPECGRCASRRQQQEEGKA